MFGAVAAGKLRRLRFDLAAAQNMAHLKDEIYAHPGYQAVYDPLYAEYLILHDYFGRGANDVMKRLKAIREQSSKVNS